MKEQWVDVFLEWSPGSEAVPEQEEVSEGFAASEAGFWSIEQAAESFLGDLRRGRVGEEYGMKERRGSLRPDTALAPVGAPDEERYVTAIPACCLRSLKEEALVGSVDRRRLSLACDCGREWWITSTLDELVARRFVTHGGPRVGDGHSAA
ncbi:MAG: hypothetical protein M3475_00045 [Actinomycetota bacterium]|nr:hypothetical protein [Actinomycetota bacterium]